MNSVISIVMRTESSDLYHFTYEVKNEYEFIEAVKHDMGTELACVYTWDINVLGDVEYNLADKLFREAMNEAEGEEVY